MSRNMRVLAALCICAIVAGCGGSTRSYGSPQVTRFATGPIYSACMSSDRKARSRSLCGCVQATADRTLSSSDQSIAVSFFKDPQRAQDIKMSKRPNHDRFWDRYKEFYGRAEQVCRGV